MKNINFKFFLFTYLVFCASEIFPQNITYQYNWYKYYIPVPGKILGTFPHENRWGDIQKFKELKYRWGFNYILFGIGNGNDRLSMVKQVGYTPSTNILMSVEANYYQPAIQYDECWGYYIDEPADRLIPFNTVQSMRDYLKSNFPNSLFVISGYKRNSDLIDYTNLLADKVLFSSYVHWWEFLGFWISWPVDPDQRDDWTDMKNLFGSKFSMTWMSANQDMSAYNSLLGHARNLGLEGVWLYQDPVGTEVDDGNLTAFCDAAVSSGFLTSYYQQVRDCYVNGNLIGRQFVGPPYSSIPSVYDHSNRVFNDMLVTNDRIDDYFASNSIAAGNPYYYIVPALKKATFNSNNEIILKAGFEAQKGCEFRAYISREQ
jgi:hypothetical protein